MARRNVAVDPRFIPNLPSLDPQSEAISLLIAAALPGLAIAMLVPEWPALSVLCLVSLFNGGVAALFAWRSGIPQGGKRLTAWDFSTACIFVGFAAGMLSDVEHGVQLFGLITAAP